MELQGGLFWSSAPRKKTGESRARVAVAAPDTGWTLPEGEALFPNLSSASMIGVDTETYDPELLSKGPGSKRDGYMVGVSIATPEGFRQYYPLRHKEGGNLPVSMVLGWLSEQLGREGQPKVGANLLYDIGYLSSDGVKMAGPFWDVQVADPLLDETHKSYSLEAIAQRRLGRGKDEDAMTTWIKQAFAGNPKGNIWRTPPQLVGPYAEEDASLPLEIFAQQRIELKEKGLWDLFSNVESKLIPMLHAMWDRGVPVDIEAAEKMRDRLGTEYKAALAEIKRQSGFAVDVWAADSLAPAFDAQGIEYPRTEGTGRPSFRKGWLGQNTSPLAQQIVRARSADKMRGTFVEGYILGGSVSGRIHCQLHQLRSDEGGTVSGRFSSSLPNLQNIPARTDIGREIRSLFVAEAGERWWKFDWSQVEYRIIVHYAALLNLAGVDVPLRAYRGDASTDYHQVMADEAGLERNAAKGLNFGLAYGQGLSLLCANLGVDIEEGKRIIGGYHERAPFIRQLMSATSHRASANGYLTTLLGRRRHFHAFEKDGQVFRDKESAPPGARRAFLHKTLNALIQGSAADIMKKAMVLLWEDGTFDALGGCPYLTVHDELDGSFDGGVEALGHVKHVMEQCVKLNVPLIADGSVGPDWGSLQ